MPSRLVQQAARVAIPMVMTLNRHQHRRLLTNVCPSAFIIKQCIALLRSVYHLIE
jgi:hypothetical protein